DSAGNVTGTVTLVGVEPAAQALVTGSPAIAGVADTVHVAERVTMADRTVAPPADGRSAGLMTTLVMAGGLREPTRSRAWRWPCATAGNGQPELIGLLASRGVGWQPHRASGRSPAAGDLRREPAQPR